MKYNNSGLTKRVQCVRVSIIAYLEKGRLSYFKHMAQNQ